MDTPRTDEMVAYAPALYDREDDSRISAAVVPAVLSRRLERELTAEKERGDRLVRLIENGRDTIRAAIASGDWVVDGAADPDSFLTAALGDSNG